MRPGSIAGVAGSLLVAATAALYLVVIGSQGNVNTRRVASVAVMLAACALLAMYASWAPSPRVRSVAFAVAAGALLGLGWLGIFSIGLLLIAAAVLLLIAASRAFAEDGSGSVVIAVLCGAIALAGPTGFVLWVG